MAVVGALPAQYLGRGPRPLYIGTATTVEDISSGSDLDQTETDRISLKETTTTRTPLTRLFFLYTIHHQPQEAIHPPHTGVGYYTTTVARTSINLVSLVLFIV